MKKKEKNRDKTSPAKSQAQTDFKISDPTKKKQTSRSPLQNLNGTISRTNSSTSIEAPKGCLSFFLSNPSSSKSPLHWPKSLSKSPKSSPFLASPNPSSSRSKPSKENTPKPTSQRFKINPPCLYHWQSGKKPTSKNTHKSNPSSGNPPFNSASGSLGFTPNQQKSGVSDDAVEPTELSAVENRTPVGKLGCGSALNSAFDEVVEDESTAVTGTKTTTPPVQACVSPEIQCGLSSVLGSEATLTNTPACYGAGHHLSGVTDKRKCKPKGILTVEENHLRCGSVKDFDAENAVESIVKSRVSLVPFPSEASMHWLDSPCDEEDKHQKSDPSIGSCRIRKLLGSRYLSSSPIVADGFGSYVCDNNNCSDIKDGRIRSRNTLLSPSGLPEVQGISEPFSPRVGGCLSSPSTPSCKAVIAQDDGKCRYNSAGASSLLSTEFLSSGNVIQTPQSDSSSDKYVGPSWLNADDIEKQYFDSDVDIGEDCLGRASLSPKSQTLWWDVPGLIFPFTGLTSPSSSIDLSHFQETWDNCASCIPDSTLDNVPQPRLRISWRDGLMSRLYEMDELDSCRCLSDDENDASQCKSNKLISSPRHELDVNKESCQIFSNGFGSLEVVEPDRRIDDLGREKNSLQVSNSCAESICSDGGDLVASGDSDWNLCYKNLLFQV